MADNILYKQLFLLITLLFSSVYCKSNSTFRDDKSMKNSLVNNANITGNYSGVLTPMVNGKKYADVNCIYTITKTDDNKMDIYLPPFQIGSMPGKLHIDIKNTTFTTDPNGNILFAGSQDQCVYLKLPLFTIKAKGTYSGSLKDKQFNIQIQSEGKIFFLKSFKTDIKFKGIKE